MSTPRSLESIARSLASCRALVAGRAALGPAPAARSVAAKKKGEPCIQPIPGLQAQVNAAGSGGTLRLCGGTFNLSGPLSIPLDLTITGTSTTVLTGQGDRFGAILNVKAGKTVRVANIAFTGGTGSAEPNGANRPAGGGVWNAGTLTLSKCRVRGNEASYGGGIFNAEDATLLLAGLTGGGMGWEAAAVRPLPD